MQADSYYIITINDIGNYGNRLQNYALQTLLRERGKVKTLQMKTKRDRRLLLKCRRAKRQALICRKTGISAWVERRESFKQFDISNIDMIRFDQCKDENSRCIAVIGSDQVWNVKWLEEPDLYYRLGMRGHFDRILSYAASIGLDYIDSEWRPVFEEGWSRMSRISVREYRAAELVKEISGRDAAVVLDPTLMLSRAQWEEVFTGFVSEDDCYVLTYFLGRPSDEQEKIIASVAESCGARVKRLNDARDRETFVAGPAEFVELFSKAQYVFTDSYHACCFSILYNKPFKVFNRDGFGGRESMNSRMKTLFRLFEIDDLMDDDETLPTYDWRRVNSLLELHREESRKWLESAVEATWR